ncbi:MAG TPA: hypothetical protein VNF03_14060 [Patescibacteria group bacterium]|nr:hypothetical protein [Patescibacteria group bacterium]
MPMTPSSTAARRPTVDEWGVYDPQQAGLAALYTKLTTPGGNPEPPATQPPSPEQEPTVKLPDR